MRGASIADALRSRRLPILAYSGVVLGGILTVFPFVTGTSTLAACDVGGGLYGRLYDLVGIYPPGYTVQIAWSEMLVYWNDGCNGHVSSLWPSIIGLPLLLLGTVLTNRRHQ